MQDFRNLEVWRAAHHLTLDVYALTKRFPKEELYGIVSQMRRASSSTATNIAEGCVRQSDADFCRFLFIALGSVSELDYLLLLSIDLQYSPSELAQPLQAQVEQVRRMLISFIQRLNTPGA